MRRFANDGRRPGNDRVTELRGPAVLQQQDAVRVAASQSQRRERVHLARVLVPQLGVT